MTISNALAGTLVGQLIEEYKIDDCGFCFVPAESEIGKKSIGVLNLAEQCLHEIQAPARSEAIVRKALAECSAIIWG